MLNLSTFKPRFWDHRDAAAGPENQVFSFRRKWLMIVLFTTIVTLTPLFVMGIVDYRLTRKAFETEITMDVSRSASGTRSHIAFLLHQRQVALMFIARDNSYRDLTNQVRLDSILEHLQRVADGFVDLMVVGSDFRTLAYSGPYPVGDDRLALEKGFERAVSNGTYISDVKSEPGKGHRFAITIRHILDNGEFLLLRTTLDADILDGPMSQLSLKEGEDVFLINQNGVLQTNTHYHGHRFDKTLYPLKEKIEKTLVMKAAGQNKEAVLIGIAPIDESPFMLVMVRPESGIVDLWIKPRMRLIGFLFVSIALIIVCILGVATYLVNRMHASDQRRVQALHQIEYANKMTSIGRLASGVAHEVNNPLAIINQKAGLVKDLLTIEENASNNEKIMGLVDDVLDSVKRCGAITRRMLDFARHMESSSLEKVELDAVIRQVLVFMEKESDLQEIAISLRVKEKLPAFESVRGNLQQIFINLINNSFAAMESGGKLDICIDREETNHVRVSVSDTGHGIPEADLKRVFEPFFSTRQGHAGTGLGLSVTYGLVTEMGGKIKVESQIDKGTCFTVTLPMIVSKEQVEEAPIHVSESVTDKGEQTPGSVQKVGAYKENV